MITRENDGMHELSFANSIISIVLKEMAERDLNTVESIGVRVGDLSCVCTEALLFGFEAATIDTALANTKLVIERVPVKGRCRSCGEELAVRDSIFICPSCGSTDLNITQGEELDIAYIEVT